MSQVSTIRYLAYGSNMLPRRIEQRLGSCEALGVVSLGGYALRFHKRGRDGSGKCDAFHTADPTHALFGVVYALTAEQQRMLDEFEGPGYLCRDVNVRMRSGVVTAYAYVAKPGHVDADLRPFHWYKSIVLAGARAHGLPSSYIEEIISVRSTPDPDVERHAHHVAMLDRDFLTGTSR